MRWFTFCFALLSLLRADGAPLPVPSGTPAPLAPGPLLAQAPAFSEWLMTVQSGAASSSTGAQINTSRTLVVKTGPVRYDVTQNGSGQKYEHWITNGMEATIVPGSTPSVTQLGGPQGSYKNDSDNGSKSDFTGFGWISKKNYIGAVQLGSGTCIVFHTGSEAGVPPPADGSTSPGRTAYITADTRLPVVLVNEDTTTTYEFRTPPNSVLPLPPAVQTAIAGVTQRMQELSSAPTGP